MEAVSPNRMGLIVALLLGGWHLLWSVLVAIGVGQAIIDFIFWMHFLKPAFVLEPFEWVRALTLIVVTSAVGYAIGVLGAVLWNACHRSG